MQHIFCCNVSSCTRRVGATAETANGSVDGTEAEGESSEHVGEGATVCVVELKACQGFSG